MGENTEAGAVKIKPLEWSNHPAGGEQALGAGLGLYRVHANSDDWYLVPDHMGKGGKAAAQADFERRILSALDPHPRATNTVDAHETANVSDKPTTTELNIRGLIADIEAGRADGFLNDGSDPHGNDLNCPHCGGSGHIDDVHPTPQEGQQEPVAYIKEVLRIFGQGCTNAGPTSPFVGNPADCDECLTAAAMSLSNRPSEQAVAEADLFNVLRNNSWDLRCFDIPTGQGDADIGWRVIGHYMTKPYERTIAEIHHDDPIAALKAAMEVGG